MKRLTVEAALNLDKPVKDTALVIHRAETPDKSLREYLLQCSRYAKTHGVMLVSAPVLHENQLCLMLFEPDGMVSLRQPALFLPIAMPELQAGDRVEVFETANGNIALCVDGDIHHPQVARAAALKGADVLICVQQSDPGAMTEPVLRRTVWNAAQSNNLYVINIACGQTAVACPAALTRAGNGYLQQPDAKDPAWFGLNMDRLEEVREQWPLLDGLNRNVVENHRMQLTR